MTARERALAEALAAAEARIAALEAALGETLRRVHCLRLEVAVEIADAVGAPARAVLAKAGPDAGGGTP